MTNESTGPASLEQSEDDDVGSEETSPRRDRPWPTPIGTQRILQIVLGAFWIVDAALQYQPFMFGNQFVPTYITGNASGQPEPLSWFITNAGHFISPNVGVWNALFATIQLVIAVGLFVPRTVRPALITSLFWAFGVWVFGEGMGGLLTGTASALQWCAGLGVHVRAARPHGVATISHRSRCDRCPLDRTRPSGGGGGRLVRRGPGHRWRRDAVDGVVGLLVPLGRPLPLPGQPGGELGLGGHQRHGGWPAALVRAFPDPRRQLVRFGRSDADLDPCRHLDCDRTRALARSTGRGVSPGRLRVEHLVLAHRARRWWRAHRIRNGPQHGPARRRAGPGHGAEGDSRPGPLDRARDRLLPSSHITGHRSGRRRSVCIAPGRHLSRGRGRWFLGHVQHVWQLR